ncbi:hypothetical protein COS54_03270 [Candidatus Shapirobacteria bacterium CG03_land_8_20_14_0_80_39_12]|uniref:Uncharacterized protein n=1 Tax=Candidatus Shapirobacteria bacterium CG03_land_8_20_14_0_80_39_12 TaxID=1974879 RepID=A0A2M7BB59_9BACT|nr:MAG: hypothetical protein COS54_03270 [Candidatus Shapirobacteria bacterium CG03_land_8_20_14_0_80_39_12]
MMVSLLDDRVLALQTEETHVRQFIDKLKENFSNREVASPDDVAQDSSSDWTNQCLINCLEGRLNQIGQQISALRHQ